MVSAKLVSNNNFYYFVNCLSVSDLARVCDKEIFFNVIFYCFGSGPEWRLKKRSFEQIPSCANGRLG